MTLLSRKETWSQSERRLATIMHTDIVGYTALGQRNESLSLALVDEKRKLLRPKRSRDNDSECLAGVILLYRFGHR